MCINTVRWNKYFTLHSQTNDKEGKREASSHSNSKNTFYREQKSYKQNHLCAHSPKNSCKTPLPKKQPKKHRDTHLKFTDKPLDKTGFFWNNVLWSAKAKKSPYLEKEVLHI